MKVSHDGSMVLFEPKTEGARIWVSENVPLESWQWMGLAFAVDLRFAEGLVEGMRKEGLEVEIG